MTKSFGLLFYLKKGRKTTAEEWPVYLRITINCIPMSKENLFNNIQHD